jgi:hypothetical protein
LLLHVFVAAVAEQIDEHAADPAAAGLAMESLVPVLRHVVRGSQLGREREGGARRRLDATPAGTVATRRSGCGARRAMKIGTRHNVPGKRALERALDELVLVTRTGRRHEHVALGGECCERRLCDELRMVAADDAT